MAELKPAHEKYAAQARDRFQRTTPFRLGMMVGEAGDSLPSPYPSGSHGTRLYEDGLEAGKRHRQRRQELAREEEEPKE